MCDSFEDTFAAADSRDPIVGEGDAEWTRWGRLKGVSDGDRRHQSAGVD